MFLILTLIVFFFFLCIAFIFGMLSAAITNYTMENRIKNILEKYNYKLISIENTNKIFKYKRAQELNWKDLIGMKWTREKIVIFKKVNFSTTDNKKITSLVVMESLFLVYNKLFFEINLETLVPVKVV